MIEILVLVFFHPDTRVPSVEELLEQPLFQTVKCPELARYGFHYAYYIDIRTFEVLYRCTLFMFMNYIALNCHDCINSM